MKKTRWIFALAMLFALAFGDVARAQDRKGWSPQAKGAVIGGLGGAAAGAIINKRNRAVGGVVGGVAGAGIGYAIGKHTDNKRKERARIEAANAAAERRDAEYRYALAHNHSGVRTGSPAAAAAMAPAAKTADPAVFAARTGYLPNDSYGTRDAAYPTSEYRRKSW